MNKFSRVLVQLYEDGYICWINLDGLIIEMRPKKTENSQVENSFIKDKVPSILRWIKNQAELTNEYLWGGTLGPNFDCSGLIQTAFFKNHIHIPRDSYQIKSFCKHLFYFKDSFEALQPGDLLFLELRKNVIYWNLQENGLYYHCSGREFGKME